MGHRQYRQPVEEWMNQTDYYGMLIELKLMENKFRDFAAKAIWFLTDEQKQFWQEFQDFRNYCRMQSNLIDKENIK